MTRRRRHVVIDGSNLATEGRTLPSLAQLREAVAAYSSDRPKDQVTVVVDATFGHRINARERGAFNKAVDNGEIVVPPAGAVGRGDGFILQVADKAGATVLSNDSFQEFHGDHSWLFEPDRLVGAKPIEGVGWVFVERLPVRGPVSRRAERMSNRARKTGKQPSTKATKKSSGSKSAGRSQSGDKSQSTKKSQSTEKSKGSGNDENRSAKSKQTDGSTGSKSKAGGQSVKLNDKKAFVGFVAVNSIGDVVEGTIDEFSSHGCYLTISGATCYLPVKAMGNPPPKRARDVVRVGDTITVKVESLDSDRRGINVSLVGAPPPKQQRTRAEAEASNRRAAQSTNSRSKKRARGEKPATNMRSTQPVATKTTKKAAAKKATKKTARKASAKKAPAKKAAKKAPARKAAKKSTKKAAKRPAAKKAAKKSTKKAAKRPAAKKAAKKSTKKAAKRPAAKKATKKSTKKTAKRPAAKKATKKSTKKTAKRPAAKKATKKSTKKTRPSAGLKKRSRTTKRSSATKRPAKATTTAQARKARRK